MGAETRIKRAIEAANIGFNEAAPSWARRPARRGGGRTQPDGFNEAAPSWARRPAHWRRRWVHHAASMRPRPVGRGDVPTCPCAPRCHRCFNEAAPSWARRRVTMSSLTCRPPCFNEAAPSWARRRRTSKSPGPPSWRFNEAAPSWARRRALREAAAGAAGSFNEAAPSWARRPVPFHGSRLAAVAASMRPRPVGRGDA